MLENREWGEDGRNLSFRETGEKKTAKKEDSFIKNESKISTLLHILLDIHYVC